MRDYLLLIQKGSSIHTHGHTVYVKEGLPFARDLSLKKTLQILTYIFNWLYFTQYLTSFSLINHFLHLFHLTLMRYSRSTQLMCLPLEALMSSIRTGFHLSQMTLLRWLTFLLRSHTVTLRVVLFWIYFSSDASTCSTMAFPPLDNSDHVVLFSPISNNITQMVNFPSQIPYRDSQSPALLDLFFS